MSLRGLPRNGGSLRSGRLPDFVILGAPKAGTTALHAALAAHPQLALSDPKEPKYFLCGDAPAPAYTGPGDAHSSKEWVWRRDDYMGLFADARRDQLCGESTPLYLRDREAHRRMADAIPQAKLIAVLRDPVDRAYSNWMHLWVDGLEPVADFVAACELEEQRVAAGWAPFWRYRELGRYGAQLQALYERFPRDQVLALRYRDLVDTPAQTLDRACEFLGVETGVMSRIPQGNTRPFIEDGPRRRALALSVRAGAWVGALFPPHLWRRMSEPLLASMRLGSTADRPHLSSEQRAQLTAYFKDDIALLEELTGTSYSDWLSERITGGYTTRARGAA